jgi:hypothetical protein
LERETWRGIRSIEKDFFAYTSKSKNKERRPLPEGASLERRINVRSDVITLVSIEKL